MTEKDYEIQQLRRRIAELEKQIEIMVTSYAACRYCKHMDDDCYPRTSRCKAEWRGFDDGI